MVEITHKPGRNLLVLVVLVLAITNGEIEGDWIAAPARYAGYDLLPEPHCNYEFSVVNPQSYILLFGVFQDLLNANRGGKYFCRPVGRVRLPPERSAHPAWCVPEVLK